ncbi:DUF6246 family protein [Cedecea colo]|uniref:Gp17 n=1 Tax=Cedecea colo TaxID=2552946 RepID=A0ABX0VKQ0_9ENTR|nr:DUF6246 family protein [Cedecea colo]NIY47264.1 hypothetical protein [Cedecea colo]
MTPLTDLGEVVLSDRVDGNKEFILRPSFSAMTRIGSPEEIVAAYATIHGSDVQHLLALCAAHLGMLPDWMSPQIYRMAEKVLSVSMQVLQACCEEDITPMIGEWKGWSRYIVYRPGKLSRNDIIIIAQHLMTHGVIGKAKVRKLQRHESSTTTAEFNAMEYINAARTHFEMTREDAAHLTMTEFALLLNAKYPNQKGLTREEYDEVMDDDERRWRQMMDREIRQQS